MKSLGSFFFFTKRSSLFTQSPVPINQYDAHVGQLLIYQLFVSNHSLKSPAF